MSRDDPDDLGRAPLPDRPEDAPDIADAHAPAYIIERPGWTDIADPPGSLDDNPGSILRTDFDEILDRRARAQVGPNGEPLDDLGTEIQMREIERDEANKVSRHINIVPATWDRGVLAQTVTLPPGTSASVGGVTTIQDGPAQRGVFWPGDDREALPVTVTVSPVQGIPEALVVRATASFRWGVMGASFQAQVDVGNGFQLSLNASSVSVEVYLEGGSYGATAATVVSYPVACAIGFFSTNRTQPVIRSMRSTVTNGSHHDFTRPLFATTLASMERDDPTQSFDVILLAIDGTVLGKRTYGSNAFVEDPIPLPGDCATVRLANNGGASVVATLCFGMF